MKPDSKIGSWDGGRFASLFIWSSWAPKMAGKDNKKEKLKASTGFRPVCSPVTIVLPDLEIPGIMARAWARPIWREFFGLSLIFFGLIFLVEKRIPLVSSKAKPTRLIELNKDTLII